MYTRFSSCRIKASGKNIFFATDMFDDPQVYQSRQPILHFTI